MLLKISALQTSQRWYMSELLSCHKRNSSIRSVYLLLSRGVAFLADTDWRQSGPNPVLLKCLEAAEGLCACQKIALV